MSCDFTYDLLSKSITERKLGQYDFKCAYPAIYAGHNCRDLDSDHAKGFELCSCYLPYSDRHHRAYSTVKEGCHDRKT